MGAWHDGNCANSDTNSNKDINSDDNIDNGDDDDDECQCAKCEIICDANWQNIFLWRGCNHSGGLFSKCTIHHNLCILCVFQPEANRCKSKMNENKTDFGSKAFGNRTRH